MAAAVVVGGASAATHPKKAKADQAVVATDAGVVRGAVANGMRAFRGIPYAAAPVGALRWRPPQPHAAWKGVRAATEFGSGCPQTLGPFGVPSTNEDCLFLNVFTPPGANPSSRLPVMFWIHGGALITGESTDYDPTALVKRGVVVVTINYRLGLLGFLAHPALSSESSTHDSGDYGLMDQQFALGWVKRNIARFGGDPANVTIFGESAGGLSVRSQLVSPGAKGLFRHAIVESGAYAETVPTLAEAESTGQFLATAMGCADQTAACLRALPVSTLLANETAISQLPNISSVLPQQYNTAFATGAFNHVPVLSGSNHDEWMLFVDLLNSQLGNPVTPDNYQAQVAATLQLPSPALAAPIVALYPLSAYPTPYNALGAVGTDAIFACNARQDVQHLSQYVPTYQYEFNDPSPPMPFLLAPVPYSLGAFHASEIQYIFATSGSTLDTAQKALSASMQGYWTNFAKTGNPNGAGLPAWPAYTVAGDQAQSLVEPAPAPETTFAAGHKCAVWSALGG
ncbi:MAG TPA: carboxylesterase family protein [Gaiellaceae bacterium]